MIMPEEKHFSYEGYVELKQPKPKQIEIIDVSFITPARIKAKIDDKEVEFNVSVDIINRKVYENNNESVYSEQIFNHLDSVNSLPEDFFQASDDIYEEAVNATKQQELIKQQVTDV